MKFGDVVDNAYKIKTCSPINSSVHCETVRSLVKLLYKEYPARFVNAPLSDLVSTT